MRAESRAWRYVHETLVGELEHTILHEQQISAGWRFVLCKRQESGRWTLRFVSDSGDGRRIVDTRVTTFPKEYELFVKKMREVEGR